MQAINILGHKHGIFVYCAVCRLLTFWVTSRVFLFCVICRLLTFWVTSRVFLCIVLYAGY